MSLNPAYAPFNETSADLLNEKTNFIGLTVMSSFCHGVLFVLYILTLNALITQYRRSTHHHNSRDRNFALFHIFYTTMLFALGTIGSGGNARVAQLTWIDNRNYPGGPNAFTIDQYDIPVNVMEDCAFAVASWFQDAYVVYRFLVFYNFNWYLAIFPVFVLMGSIASSIVWMFEVSQPGGSIWTPLGMDFTTSWFMLSVFLNVLATLFIVGRLLYKRKSIIQSLGKQHSKMYVSVAAMLIESAALYSISGVIFVATFMTGNPIQNVMLPVLGMTEMIAPMLIMYRVATGRAWSQSTLTQISTTNAPVSSLKFTPRSQQPPASSFGYGKTSTLPTSNGMNSVTVVSTAEYELREVDADVDVDKESSYSNKEVDGRGVLVSKTSRSYVDV